MCEDGQKFLNTYVVKVYVPIGPERALKFNNKILRSILKLTVSQWSEARVGVLCPLLVDGVRNLAAVFWTSCDLCRLKQVKRELQ